MKGSVLGLAIAIACAGSAFASPELELVVGANTVVCAVSGSGCTITSSSATYVAAPFFGWTVVISSGITNSPSLTPVGLDLSVQATCGSCTSPLDVYFSDIGFTPTGGSLVSTDGVNDSGPGNSTTQSAWFSTANTDFAGSGLPGTGTGTKIGSTIGPLVGVTSGTTSGAGPVTSPYSLTIEQTFAASAGAGYSTDGNLTGTPEPGAIVLLGTILMICGTQFRRRKREL